MPMSHVHRVALRSAATKKVRLTVVFALLVVALVFASASSAFAITRATVLSRAQSWVDHPVAYSQSKYHLGYRTDCSGYVSMCWATGTSWATASFHAVTHPISKSELKPGDAMLKKGYHIRLFHNWANSSHTSYVAYEAGTKVAVVRVHSLASDLGAGYVPTRYNGILDGPASNNVIWNSSFDAWTGTWGQGGEEPVTWELTGPEWQTLVAHRTDVYHSGHSSLQLLNPSDDPDTYTELSQTAPVVAGAIYGLSGWARSASDPAGLTLSVTYLDAANQTLAEHTATGSASALSGTSFTLMSSSATAPAGAANAVVTVRLAGGHTTGPSGDVSGTSAILDDITLTRAQVSVGIKASSAAVRANRTVALSGSVSPSTAASLTATVYVQRPRAGWKRLAVTPIVTSESGTAWRYAVAFTRGMRKGVYRFKVTVPGPAGYLGATTKVVSVRLK